jgi:hypothetical protein
MHKPAQVLLQFDNAGYAFWRPIADKADKKAVFPLSDGAAVILAVKHFDMSDHQFIQLKLTVDKGKELDIWVPRNFLKAIVQGKTDLSDAFSFAGKTSN